MRGALLADATAHEVVSLPMHPYLTAETQDEIIATIRAAVA